MTRKLSPSEQKALRYIAENGPTYAYNLARALSHLKTKLFDTEKTANIALNSLAREELLEKKETGQNRTRKDYYLTLKGLCYALHYLYFSNSEKFYAEIENIINRWGHLLPLLKKYELFKKHNLEGYFKETLIGEATKVVAFQGLWLKDNADHILEDFIERSMRKSDAEFMMKWNHILFDDVELRQRTKWYLELEKEMKEQYLEELTERLSQVFPKLECPNPDWNELQLIEDKLAGAHICDSGIKVDIDKLKNIRAKDNSGVS
jgi:DNA-binding PadR family transcriptional regulator